MEGESLNQYTLEDWYEDFTENVISVVAEKTHIFTVTVKHPSLDPNQPKTHTALAYSLIPAFNSKNDTDHFSLGKYCGYLINKGYKVTVYPIKGESGKYDTFNVKIAWN